MPDETVLLLDDDDDLRETLTEVMENGFGRACVGVRSVAELMQRRQDVLACHRAVLDVNLGPGVPSGLDAYRWLRSEGFTGPIVFLTGHAGTHPLVAEAQRIGSARLVGKPASMAAI